MATIPENEWQDIVRTAKQQLRGHLIPEDEFDRFAEEVRNADPPLRGAKAFERLMDHLRTRFASMAGSRDD